MFLVLANQLVNTSKTTRVAEQNKKQKKKKNGPKISETYPGSKELRGQAHRSDLDIPYQVSH